jgi:hypothetical protein
VSLAGEAALALETSEAPHPSGGHILRTSGTTGIYKMVLRSSTFDAVCLRRRVPGDLAVTRSDGRMALQGRLTDVINVQGKKISPAPIEDRLGELLGLSGVSVFSMQDNTGEEEIHVVLETPTPIDSKQLSADRDRGEPRGSAPPTPPYVRVRIRRFEKLR